MSTIAPSQVHTLSVTAIANAVAKGDLTPEDVAEAVLARISKLEPEIQAWSWFDPRRIREEARVLTQEAVEGRLRGPLHGVPIGIKDELHVQGMPTGYLDRPTPVPEVEDATSVARLRAAGALIVGKTYMPNYSLGMRMCPTRNPWNLEHTPGGSSSGSGAAVGARMVPVAISEQSGGSGLRPAAYCGVDGLVPTYGRVSRFGCVPFTFTQDRVGLIGLTMEDIALVLSVIAGPDPRDPTTLPDPAPPANLNMWDVRPPRIGIVRNFFPDRSQPVMLEAIDNAAKRLREAGATVEDYMLPEMFGLTWDAGSIVFGAEGAAFHAQREVAGPEPGTTAIAGERRTGSIIPATYYLHAQRIRRWLHAKVSANFRDLDALMMAPTPTPAPRDITTTGDASLLSPWSFLGYPAITINGGLSPEGMPVGLQIVAAPKEEYRLLQVGAWSEDVLGRLPAPPLAR